MLWTMIGAALALDCDDFNLTDSLPVSGAHEQPQNTQIVLAAYASYVDDAPRLINAETGASISTTVTHFAHGTQHRWVLEPRSLLAPGTAYRAELLRGGEVADSISFITGSGTDVVAPDAPSVLGTDSAFASDTWGDWASFSVEIDPVADDAHVYYELTLTPLGGEALVRYSMTADARFFDDPCNSDEAGLLEADSAAVEVVAIDVAGNRSDGGGYTPPSGGGPGCSVAAAPAGLLAALLALAGARRRER